MESYPQGAGDMHRNLSVLAIGVLAASLSGCQLVEALLLDDQGQATVEGICATYQVVATDVQPVTPEILEQTRSIIEHRVDATGVADPVVVTEAGDRISVELPGIEDEADIRSLIGTTGILEFVPVPPELQGAVGEGPLPEGMADIEPLFTGTEIASSASVQDETTGEFVLDLQLKDTGARLFDEYAADHFGEQFAIVLDGQVMSAPAIRATRFGGQMQISGGTGGFTVSEVQALVTVLRFGSLPLEIREVSFGPCETSRPSTQGPGATLRAIVQGQLSGTSDSAARPSAVSEPDVPAPPQKLRVGRSLGDPDAPVRIDVFMDPQCPPCGVFAQGIEPLLVAGPIARGEVLLTYKDFPFIGPESLDAAMAMRVVEGLGGEFWDYHQLVYFNQDDVNEGAFSRDRLADMAELIGLDREAFLLGMEDPEYLAAVRAENDEATSLGINSTPSLVVNGTLTRGLPTWDDLSAEIDAQLRGHGT